MFCTTIRHYQNVTFVESGMVLSAAFFRALREFRRDYYYILHLTCGALPPIGGGGQENEE